MIRLDDIDARTRWWLQDAPDLGEPALPSCDPEVLLADGPHPFDLSPRESRTFFATTEGFTRCVVGDEPSREALGRLTPRGAVVSRLQTCAIVDGAEVLRVWQHAWSTDHRLIVPAADGAPAATALDLGGSHPIKWSVGRAVGLSTGLGSPVLVVRRHVLLPHGPWPSPPLDVAPGVVDDATKWRSPAAASYVPGAVPDCAYPSSADAGPPLFDTTHDDVARFYATAYGHTACLFDDGDVAALPGRIPMGYANLYLREKRAVVHAGDVLRVWPRRYERAAAAAGGDGTEEEYVLTVGEAAWRPRGDLGPEPTLALALRAAVRLSARGGTSVLVSRTLRTQTWH